MLHLTQHILLELLIRSSGQSHLNNTWQYILYFQWKKEHHFLIKLSYLTAPSWFLAQIILRQRSASNSSAKACLNITWFARDPNWFRLPVMLVCESWTAFRRFKMSVTPSMPDPDCWSNETNSLWKLGKDTERSAFNLVKSSETLPNWRRPISSGALVTSLECFVSWRNKIRI